MCQHSIINSGKNIKDYLFERLIVTLSILCRCCEHEQNDENKDKVNNSKLLIKKNIKC